VQNYNSHSFSEFGVLYRDNARNDYVGYGGRHVDMIYSMVSLSNNQDQRVHGELIR
jgi:hypothetical protein